MPAAGSRSDAAAGHRRHSGEGEDSPAGQEEETTADAASGGEEEGSIAADRRECRLAEEGIHPGAGHIGPSRKVELPWY